MVSKNARQGFLRRALIGVDEETVRVRSMISSGELPSPVTEKVMEQLARQRQEIVTELQTIDGSVELKDTLLNDS